MTYLGDKDFLAEVAKGNVAGHSLIHKFGRNPAAPNGTWAFVTTLGQTAHALSAATTVRIKAGGDAEDAAAGDNAREITVQGIDSNFAEITEAITTAGASASDATTASFWRVHRAWVSSCGTYGAANLDDVVIENSGGGTDIITIAAGEGQTQDAIWTVPLGKTAYMMGVSVTVDAAKPADIRIFTRADIDDTSAPMESKRLKKYFDGIKGHLPYQPRSPELMIAAKSDIWAEALGDGNATAVAVDIELLVVDD